MKLKMTYAELLKIVMYQEGLSAYWGIEDRPLQHQK